MPPRAAAAAGSAAQHRSKMPSLLDSDAEQLSPLSHARLSAAHTSVHIGGVDEEEEDSQRREDSIPYGADEDELPVGEEVTDDEQDDGSGSQALQLEMDTDPSRSGEFDAPAGGCCARTWRAILQFPALQTIFPIVFVLSMFTVFIVAAASPAAFDSLANPALYQFLPSVPGFVLSLLTCIFLSLLCLLATRQLLYQLFQGEIAPLQIVGLYLATILLYGDLYMTAAFLDPHSFVFEVGTEPDPTTNVVSIWVAFQYFSVSTITCTGYGDIAPALAGPKVIAWSADIEDRTRNDGIVQTVFLELTDLSRCFIVRVCMCVCVCVCVCVLPARSCYCPLRIT